MRDRGLGGRVSPFFTKARPSSGDSSTQTGAAVFNADYKLIQRMAPSLKRVLILDPQPAACRLLTDLLRNIVECQIWTASEVEKGLSLAKNIDPHIIFVEHVAPQMDGVAFIRQLRHSHYACRQAPVVMTTSQATAATIMAARDAGAHEFLRKPFTIKDLMRRLEAVTLRPRDWIEAVHYVGPDRRRFNSGDYAGPLKRRTDARETPNAARISQALKILKSAVAAVETDPAQAMRSIQAQAIDLQRAAVSTSNLALAAAAADFQKQVSAQAAKSPLNVAQAETLAAELLAFLPKETGGDPQIAAA